MFNNEKGFFPFYTMCFYAWLNFCYGLRYNSDKMTAAKIK